MSAVEASQSALESVRGHSERIPEMIKPLEPVLSGINAQTEVLGSHLETLASLRDKAIDAFPVIEKNLERITTQFAANVDDTVEKSRQNMEDAQRAHAELRTGYDAFLKDASDARERFAAELSAALKKMADQSVEEFARHGELIETSAS